MATKYKITFHAQDEAGSPLAGVTLRWTWDGATFQNTTTDASGNISYITDLGVGTMMFFYAQPSKTGYSVLTPAPVNGSNTYYLASSLANAGNAYTVACNQLTASPLYSVPVYDGSHQVTIAVGTAVLRTAPTSQDFTIKFRAFNKTQQPMDGVSLACYVDGALFGTYITGTDGATGQVTKTVALALGKTFRAVVSKAGTTFCTNTTQWMVSSVPNGDGNLAVVAPSQIPGAVLPENTVAPFVAFNLIIGSALETGGAPIGTWGSGSGWNEVQIDAAWKTVSYRKARVRTYYYKSSAPVGWYYQERFYTVTVETIEGISQSGAETTASCFTGEAMDPMTDSPNTTVRATARRQNDGGGYMVEKITEVLTGWAPASPGQFYSAAFFADDF